jgi:hypothetical protein
MNELIGEPGGRTFHADYRRGHKERLAPRSGEFTVACGVARDGAQ